MSGHGLVSPRVLLYGISKIDGIWIEVFRKELLELLLGYARGARKEEGWTATHTRPRVCFWNESRIGDKSLTGIGLFGEIFDLLSGVVKGSGVVRMIRTVKTGTARTTGACGHQRVVGRFDRGV